MEQRRKWYHHRTTIYVPVPVLDKTGVLGKMNSPEPTPEAHTVCTNMRGYCYCHCHSWDSTS